MLILLLLLIIIINIPCLNINAAAFPYFLQDQNVAQCNADNSHFNALCSQFTTLFPFTSFLIHHSQYHSTTGSYITQGCTNPRCWVVRATKFCNVAPIICGFSACNFLRVNHSGAWSGEVASRLLENFCTRDIANAVKEKRQYATAKHIKFRPDTFCGLLSKPMGYLTTMKYVT
jgi:hypothetical protein